MRHFETLIDDHESDFKVITASDLKFDGPVDGQVDNDALECSSKL